MHFEIVDLPDYSLLSENGQKFIEQVQTQYLDKTVVFLQKEKTKNWDPDQSLFAAEIIQRIKKFSQFCSLVRTQKWSYMIAADCLDTHWEFALSCKYRYQFQKQKTGWSLIGPYDPYCSARHIVPPSYDFKHKNPGIHQTFALSIEEIDIAIELPILIKSFLGCKESLHKTPKLLHSSPQTHHKQSLKHLQKKDFNAYLEEDSYFAMCAHYILKNKAPNQIDSLESPQFTWAIDAGKDLPPRIILKTFIQGGHNIFVYCAEQKTLLHAIETLYRKLNDPSLWKHVFWALETSDFYQKTSLSWLPDQRLKLQTKYGHGFLIPSTCDRESQSVVFESHKNTDLFNQELKTAFSHFLVSSSAKMPLIHMIRIYFINEIIQCSKHFQNDMQSVMNALETLKWGFLSQPYEWDRFLLHWNKSGQQQNLTGIQKSIYDFDRWSQIKSHRFHEETSSDWSVTEFSQHLYLFSEALMRDSIHHDRISSEDSVLWSQLTHIPQHMQENYIQQYEEERFQWEAQRRWPHMKTVSLKQHHA